MTPPTAAATAARRERERGRDGSARWDGAPGGAARPVLAVAGMAFEARIAQGDGRDNVVAVYAARAALLERALRPALERGAAGVISFGTAGGLAPGLDPGDLVVADAVDGPFGRIETDSAWSARIGAALEASPLAGQVRVRRGVEAAVAEPLTGAAEKAGLHRSTGGALAVDMESHLAAALAAEHGVPFVVCRAVVDPAWRSLPRAALVGLRDDGSTTILPILRELARHPAQLGALLRVAADARAARRSLAAARRVLASSGALSPGERGDF